MRDHLIAAAEGKWIKTYAIKDSIGYGAAPYFLNRMLTIEAIQERTRVLTPSQTPIQYIYWIDPDALPIMWPYPAIVCFGAL